MCSRTADEFVADDNCGENDDLLIKCQKISKLQATRCKKCANEAAVVLRENDVYCIPCLQVSVKHKFRSCLGKSKMMKSGEKVLIAFSGGQASVALMQLIKDGLTETSHKRLRFIPHVIHIDEGMILKREQSERADNLKMISSIITSYGFPAYISSLELIMAPSGHRLFAELAGSPVTSLDEICNMEYADHLQDLFHSVQSLTSKEDLLLKLRNQLLAQIARELGCSKIFLGNSETRIAVRVLTDLALGSGQHLAQTCGFADSRCPDVNFIRPLREILAKELSIYVNSLRLQTVIQPKLSTKHDGGKSIQRLTESFVLGLQQDFPATVSTIFRTGDKMESALPKRQQANHDACDPRQSAESMSCIMCFGNVDIQGESLSEKPDSKVDEVTMCGKSLPDSCCNECQCSAKSNDNIRLTSVDIMKFLCYSCRLIFKDMTSFSAIPPRILSQAAYLQRREKMKAEISEFLLDSNDA